MKRVFCILLMTFVLVCSIGYSESDSSNEVPEKLAKMAEVLGAFARSVSYDGDFVYDDEDPVFVWTVLWRCGLQMAQEESPDSILISVSEDEMLRRASVCFCDLTKLPEIPSESDISEKVRYNAETGSYILACVDVQDDGFFAAVDRYAPLETGEVLASVSLPGGSQNLVVTLCDNPREDELPYRVVYAYVENAPEQNIYTVPREYAAEVTPEAGDPSEILSYLEQGAEILVEQRVNNYETLRLGDSGQRVAALQRRLNELGYRCGSEDGEYGARLESAVWDFQAVLGRTKTGVADTETQKALYASDAPKKGAAVRAAEPDRSEEKASQTASSSTSSSSSSSSSLIIDPEFSTHSEYTGGQYVSSSELSKFYTNFNSAMNSSGYRGASSTQKAVSMLQSGLGISQTGTYDLNTYVAVASYNKSHGLGSSGIASYSTIQSLIRHLQNK